MDRSRLHRHPEGEDGFSLVEAMVAVLVVAGAVLALVPLQSSALTTVVLAEQRQQATAHADQALELVRARAATSFATVAAGRRPTSDDTALASCPSPTTCAFSFDGSGSTPLNVPAGTTAADAVLAPRTDTSPSGQTYRTRLFVASTVSPGLVSVIAVTEWASTSTRGAARRVALRTQIADPARLTTAGP